MSRFVDTEFDSQTISELRARVLFLEKELDAMGCPHSYYVDEFCPVCGGIKSYAEIPTPKSGG